LRPRRTVVPPPSPCSGAPTRVAGARVVRAARRLLPVAAVVAALAIPASPAIARAEPTEAELAQARERFKQARKLEDAGKWSEALEQLQRVAEVKMTPQVRFHIALCLENIGLLTQALDGYAQAAAEAGTGAPEVVREAKEHIKKLEGVIPTVSIGVTGAAPGDELYLDRRKIPIDDRPLAIRADPGPHCAEVRRGNELVAREYFTLPPKSTKRLELKIGSVAATPPDVSAGPKDPGDGAVRRALGWSAIGLGAASVVATGVFIGLRAGALGRLEEACPAMTQCDPAVDGIVREGKTYAALVNVFGVLAGAAAVTGVILLVTAPPRSQPKPAASIRVSPTLGGLWVEGAF
jgi:hypothetical protein